jgi:hypothetical protein
VTTQETLELSAKILSLPGFDANLAFMSIGECPRPLWKMHQLASVLCWRQELLGPRCGCRHRKRSDLAEHALGGGIYDAHFDPFDDTLVMECTKCSATWMWSCP